MEGKPIRLDSLNLDELTGVVNLYPWYAGARKELCARMAGVGGTRWGLPQYADAALYVPARERINDILRATHKGNYSDKDIQHILKRLITPPADGEEERAPAPAPVTPPPARPAARVPGGDFFSSDQYAAVRRADDNFFSRMRIGTPGPSSGREWEDPELGFCTETLAGIFADQGYYTEAKKIYSRLILRYPEKSAYFASLIEKIDKRN